MTTSKLAVVSLFGIFTLLSISNESAAQAKTYKPTQVIKLGAGESLEVIRCKGEMEDQQCELRHLVNNKQVGKSFWLKSAKVVFQNTLPKATIAVATRRPTLPNKQVTEKTPSQDNKAIAKNEAAALQAEMLAMAKMLAQNSAHQQQPETSVKENIQDAEPKKAKKEFVSLNPYLQKKTQ